MYIGGRKPQLIEPTLFEDHIDLNFKIEEDENKAYSALKIMEPTLDMHGDYQCKVSTFEDEDYVHQSLFIYGKDESRQRKASDRQLLL